MTWQVQIEELSVEWATIDARARAAQDLADVKQVAGWERAFLGLADEAARLKNAGKWRSGPLTLLELLGVHGRELTLVQALGWLLQPDGHHGLGDLVLTGLLSRLEVAPPPTAPVTVHLEETRREAGIATRADLVLRIEGTCVLIEAKVYSGEHGGQCDRLARLWSYEQPTLVFLTRHGDPPYDAPVSRDRWRPLTWADVADVVAAAVLASAVDQREASPGALEVLQTLQAHHS